MSILNILFPSLGKIRPAKKRSNWTTKDYLEEYLRLVMAASQATLQGLPVILSVVLAKWGLYLAIILLLSKLEILSSAMAALMLLTSIPLSFYLIRKATPYADRLIEREVKIDSVFYTDFVKTVLGGSDSDVLSFMPNNREPNLSDLTLLVSSMSEVIQRHSQIEA